MTDSPQTSATVWALTDDRPGNNAQVLGVAQAFGGPIEEKAIRYSALARLPNLLRGASLIGVDDETRAHLSAPWPDVVIAAGRRVAPVARWIKRQSQGKTKLVQIMFPGHAGAKDFDIIAMPAHDAKLKVSLWPNVITITGAPSLITSELLSEEAVQWKGNFDSLPRPLIAVIVGGATRRKNFSPVDAFDLGGQVAALAKVSGGSVLLTTSRRTGKSSEAALIQTIPEPCQTFLWGQDGENPYRAFLALADAIVVTGDSVSMCAEACATKTPVYIYAPAQSVSAKHARFHQELYDKGYARPLGKTLEGWSRPSLNPAEDIAVALRRVLSAESTKG
ncbi:MAG: nucleoside-diphosphate sugar epimerase [Alphaproteobacteria bacterium]|nr:nucleoside-diphosphate sugar epimerase [Alphaproteobacteria bacterium]